MTVWVVGQIVVWFLAGSVSVNQYVGREHVAVLCSTVKSGES